MNPKPADYRPRHSGYVSEYDQFHNAYMAGHPGAERDQRRGWTIWWDRQVDLADWKKQREDAVPVKSYQYE